MHLYRPVLLTLSLALWSPAALAADVTVTLPAGGGFVVKDNTGAIERLRVDEATGNVSRNGALFVHTTGTDNLFVGVGVGNTSTSGLGRNTAFGSNALTSNTTGVGNSAFGFRALRYSTGGNNSAFGQAALRYNTTATANSAFGARALYSNTTGTFNAAFGENALFSNATSSRNSAFGHDALQYNTASDNSAFGISALGKNTAGSVNSAFGRQALSSNTTGSSNSAFGGYALRNNIQGSSNSAFGIQALRDNTTGVNNSAFGGSALEVNTTGRRNSAFGIRALRNSTGQYNSAFGVDALYNNTTGSNNVAVGYNAGEDQTTGSDNIYLANEGVAAESGQIKIGNTTDHTDAHIAGIHGSSVDGGSDLPLLVDSTGKLGTTTSSIRFKEAVRDIGDASTRLMALRPVSFRYKEEVAEGNPTARYGLIAEEVAEVAPELVVYDAEGEPYSVRYHLLSPMLLNEMQKQQRTLETLLARVEMLEARAQP